MTVAHHDSDIEDMEILTCRHIRFDRHSHYSDDGGTAEVVPGLELHQLWDWRGTVSFERFLYSSRKEFT
jgi:hypothetical protein